MSMVVWVMMGIALWHFAVFVPDRFWGGIVGAFLVAIVGAALFGWIVSGFSVPGRSETDLVSGLIGIPGGLVALVVSWWYGNRQETEHRPEVL